MEQKNCPKCGFYMSDNTCPKCGYFEGSNVIKIEHYIDQKSDLELLLKDEYQKIIHNKNSFLIFLLGPLYLSYYQQIPLSILILIIDLFLQYLFCFTIGLGILPIIFPFLLFRMIYTIFFNPLLIKILKKKIHYLKEKEPDHYRELIYQYEPKSTLSLAFTFLLLIASLLIIVLIYRIVRGNI